MIIVVVGIVVNRLNKESRIWPYRDMRCPNCEGVGYLDDEEGMCYICKGLGKLREDRD